MKNPIRYRGSQATCRDEQPNFLPRSLGAPVVENIHSLCGGPTLGSHLFVLSSRECSKGPCKRSTPCRTPLLFTTRQPSNASSQSITPGESEPLGTSYTRCIGGVETYLPYKAEITVVLASYNVDPP